MSVPELPSYLQVVEARDRCGPRESLTHLCYVAVAVDGEAARFHQEVGARYTETYV
jgi:hypothetical protein